MTACSQMYANSEMMSSGIRQSEGAEKHLIVSHDYHCHELAANSIKDMHNNASRFPKRIRYTCLNPFGAKCFGSPSNAWARQN